MKNSALSLIAPFLLLGSVNGWTQKFCVVDSEDIVDCTGITVYTDRENFELALSEQVLRKTVACSNETHFAVEMPFIQGDLSFEIPEGYESNRIALFGADHPRAVNFDGVPSYRFNAGRLTWNQGQPIEVGHPFTAMGFDVAHAVGGNRFAIDIFGKVFDDEYLYNNYWPVGWPDSDKSKAYFVGRSASADKGSKFFGFITDGNPVTGFTLGASERGTPVNEPDAEKTFQFLATNFVFGVTDGSEPRENSEECVYYHPKSCRGRGYGDPHIKTFDGFHYDAHIKGEAIMLKSLQSDLEVQARFQSIESDASVGPSSTTGVAIKYDEYHPNIQISIAEIDDPDKQVPVLHGLSCPVNLYVNGTYYNINAGYDASGVTVEVDPDNVGFIYVTYPDLEVRLVTRKSTVSSLDVCVFSVQYTLTEDCRPCEDLVGLLGNTNEYTQDDWMDINGTTIPVPDNEYDSQTLVAYEYTRDNWCINDASQSLFTYETGYDFDSYYFCNSPYDQAIEDFADADDPDILAICGANQNCQLDANVLGAEFAADEEQLDFNVGDDSIEDVVEPDEFTLFLAGEGDGSLQVIDVDGRQIGVATPQKTWKDYRWCYYEDPEDGTASPTGPKPPSGSNGDPHFKTWQNEHFEYHGQCDLVLAKDQEFANGLGLDVQIRTKLIRFWSYIKQAAIRIGDDILEVQGSADPEADASYWINLEYQGKLETIGGFPVTSYRKGTLGKWIYEIDLDSKFPNQKIVLSTYKEFVRVDFENASEEAFGNCAGMLGDFKTGLTFSRDGMTILDDFTELGEEWQILPVDNMLFHDISEPQFPKQCIEPEDPRGERRRRLDESVVNQEQAEAACAFLTDPLDRKDCIYDVLATQDLDMVGAF